MRDGRATDQEGVRLAFLTLLIPVACSTAPRLDEVDAWAVQLQGFDRLGAVERIVDSPYDLVVIDVVDSVKGMERFDTKGVVRRVREGGRLCLAYLNVGQAEEYRRDFDARFVLAADPEGWKGDYVARFWEDEWRALVLRRVDVAIERGFDGVYLDWVLAFEIVDDGRERMAELISALAAHGRAKRPGFLVVMQNGGALLPDVPVDGYAQECVSFRGQANAAWEDPEAADIPLPATGDWSTEALLARVKGAKGVKRFTLDYAAKPANVELARRRAREAGAVPFVSRVSLDRLP